MNGISWIDSWRRAMLGPNCEYKNLNSVQFQREERPIEAVYAVQDSKWRVGAKDRSLLVKIHKQENEISCEVLNCVFSNTGNIETIEVFAHDTPFHSRIYFCEPDGAIRALQTYNGRCIYDGCCEMELSLGYRVEGTLSQIGVPNKVEQVPSTLDQTTRTKFQREDRSLLVKIHKQENEISCEVLNCVFSNTGNIETIEVFAHDTPFHSRIYFCEPDGAIRALQTYNGRCIYDSCCEMELFLGYRVEGTLSQIGVPNKVEQVPSTLDQTTRTEFFEDKVKEIERLLLDWRVERNSQFAEVHASESRIEIERSEKSTSPSEIWKSPSQSSALDKVDEPEVSFNVITSQQHVNSKQEFEGDSLEGMELCSPVEKDSYPMKLTASETRSPLRSSSMEAIEMILQFGSKSKGDFVKIPVSDFPKSDLQDHRKEIDNSTQDFASSEADSVSNKPFRADSCVMKCLIENSTLGFF